MNLADALSGTAQIFTVMALVFAIAWHNAEDKVIKSWTCHLLWTSVAASLTLYLVSVWARYLVN